MLFQTSALKKLKVLFRSTLNTRLVFLNHPDVLSEALQKKPKKTLELILEETLRHDQRFDRQYGVIMNDSRVLDCFLQYAEKEMRTRYLRFFWDTMSANLNPRTASKNSLNNVLIPIGYRVEKYRNKMALPQSIVEELRNIIKVWDSLSDGEHPDFMGGSLSNDDKKKNVIHVLKQFEGH